MQLLEGVVVPPLVAQIEDQVRTQVAEVALERAVIVQEAELEVRQFGQCVLELAHRVEVLGVEHAAELDLVGEAVVAHEHRDVERLQLALLAHRQMWRIGAQQKAPRHHAQVLVAVGQRLGVAVVAYVAEAGLVEQLGDALARIEALGVELIGDHAHLVVDDDLARDQALSILADRALTADEVVLVDPLPRALVEVLVHVPAVGDVEHQLSAGPQDLADRGQDLLVVLLVGEVAERVAHDGDAIHAALGQAGIARVAFLEQHLQPFALRALLGEAHEVARAVEAHDVLEAAPGKLQAVPALPAAQIEDVAVRLDCRRGDDEVHLPAGVLQVLDDIAVGLHIKSVEELPPPLFGKVRLQIGHRTQARTR